MRFALMGVAGFVAPRHMNAIQEVGGELVAACDMHDSVGILDRYAPDCEFFKREDRFFEYVKRNDVDWLVVCTPNFLHEANILSGINAGLDVICEKPLCTSTAGLAVIVRETMRTRKMVRTILQLRLHPEVDALKTQLDRDVAQGRKRVRLEYVTRRGKWYWRSWKGSENLSGGLLMNIGIHFFDLMLYLFGDVRGAYCEWKNSMTVMGTLNLERANVEWKLSVDASELPGDAYPTYRQLDVTHEDGHTDILDLSAGFEDLHVASYREILAGDGYNVGDIVDAISLVERLNSGPRKEV